MPTRQCFVAIICAFTSLLLNGFLTRHVYAVESTLTEQDYFADIPVVLSATRLPQSAEDAPVAVTIITREMIEASGATEIPDLFRLVPGFLVDYDSGHIQAVSYHMLENRYVRQQQVLIDGRSVYAPLLGGVPWTELPITIDDIERIEVVRGSNAATYGSNSFLGVINIITKNAILDKGTAVKANVGTNNLREGFMRYGNNNGALDYRVNLAYRSDDGFDERHDGKIVRLINTRFDYQLNNKDNFVIQAGYNEGPREIDNTFDDGIPFHDKQSYSQFQQVKWQRVNTVDDEYSLQFYHNQLTEIDSYERTDLPIYVAEDYTAERFDLEFQKIKRLTDNLRYVVGASYRLDRVASQFYFGTTTPLDNYIGRLFAHGEYRINDFLINLGVMLEDNDVTGTDVSPRASLNYKLNTQNTLRLSYSEANRTPVLFEEYPNMAITTPVYNQFFYDDREVNNERITEYEIGLVGHSKNYDINYDVKVFYQDIRGLIYDYTLTPFPDYDNETSIFDNFDDAIIRGFESGMDLNLSKSTKLHIAFAHIDIDSTDFRGEYSKAAPSSILNLLAIHKFEYGYTGSLAVYYRSSMKPLARRSYDPEYMNPYTRVDLRLAKHFIAGKTSQDIAIVIRNVFNAYQDTRLKNNVEQGAYLTYQIKLD